MTVKVSIAHGNIAFARYPVLVGHYAGEPPSTAERYLDSLLDNHLQRRAKLGVYPGEPGTAHVFLAAPGSQVKHAGAVVVGLGKVGELTPGSLLKTVTNGLMEYANELLDNSDDLEATPLAANLTALLIGCGPKGLSIESAVAGILEGIYQANSTLSSKHFPVAVKAVEFMELWEDRAILAAHAIRLALQKPELNKAFDPGDGLVIHTPSGHIRAALTKEHSVWRHLQIKGTAEGSLNYTLITERTRSEVEIVENQKQLLDQFVNEATHYTGNQENLSETLFKYLIPNTLKDHLRERENLLLMLNEASAKYPWELLVDPENKNQRPLSVDVSMIRKLDTADFRQQVNSTTRNTALVIGNPQSSLADLPAAQTEAQTIQSQLIRHNYEVTSLINSTSIKIVEALLADNYRILHLAGHGVYKTPLNKLWPEAENGDQLVTGMVIGDQTFLTTADIEKMETIPDLVFVNCCNLGKIEDPSAVEKRQLHHLAANLAEEFMQIGVKVVIAAGWSVEDNSSNLFADTFYQEILNGEPFGHAVLTSRQAVYDNYSGFNTWGAYQCYGDPDFQLFDTTESPNNFALPDKNYHAISEVRDDLSNLISDIQTLPAKDVINAKNELKKLLQKTTNLPDIWLKDAALSALLGQAHSELDQFEQAIDAFNRAIDAETDTAPIDLIEKLADLKSRYAVDLWQNGNPKGQTTPADLIADSISLLNSMLNISHTAQHLSCLGNVYKRQAIISEGDERIAAIHGMLENSHQAHDLALEKGLEANAVLKPGLDWITAAIVLSWYDPAVDGKKESIWESLQEMGDYLNQHQNINDFYFAAYSSINSVDFNFLVYLLHEELEKNIKNLMSEFQIAHNKTLDPAGSQELLARLSFVEEMAKQRQPDLANALRELYNSME